MKLNEITKVSELMDVLNWDLDEHGMVITDYAELIQAVVRRFPELEDDMSPDEVVEPLDFLE